jgi:hypothetical protein
MQIVHMQPRVLFKRLLNRTRAFVERKPALRKFFLMLLNRFPRLKLLLPVNVISVTRTSSLTGVTPEIYSSATFIRKEKIVSQVLDSLGPQK